MKVFLQLTSLAVMFSFIESKNTDNNSNNLAENDMQILEDIKYNILQAIKNVYTEFKTFDAKQELTTTPSNSLNTTTRYLMGKRSSSESLERWLCRTTTDWKHLGQGYYPENLREIVCDQTRCIYGNYGCQPYYYRLLVIKRRDGNNAPEDTNMPSQLRRHWRFSEINLSVGCECRPYI
ncbi:hypothetical protein ACF0H5_016290 [Mactra antiquata]